MEYYIVQLLLTIVIKRVSESLFELLNIREKKYETRKIALQTLPTTCIFE